ncbi:hypothetical protein FQN54_002051 [Arachnomyces sp. PD_36]|nr:hypothetical protein FQN54_002051 [Arachnomyces sp. PD_36]
MLLRDAPILAALFLFSPVWATQSYPQTAEIDLIFPLNDTYLPLYPFPVVFAIRNPAAMWPFNFQFRYEFDVYLEEEGRFSTMISGLEDYGHYPWDKGAGDIEYKSDEDPLILVNATKIMNRVNETTARLTWGIGFSTNCTEDSDPRDPPQVDLFEDSVYLTISRSNGSLPDFSASAPCPKLVGAVTIDGEVGISGTSGYPEVCPMLPAKQPKGDPCGLKIDDSIAAKVANASLEFVGCENGKWPNATATTCDELGSGSRIQPFVGWLGVFGLAVACIFVS